MKHRLLLLLLALVTMPVEASIADVEFETTAGELPVRIPVHLKFHKVGSETVNDVLIKVWKRHHQYPGFEDQHPDLVFAQGCGNSQFGHQTIMLYRARSEAVALARAAHPDAIAATADDGATHPAAATPSQPNSTASVVLTAKEMITRECFPGLLAADAPPPPPLRDRREGRLAPPASCDGPDRAACKHARSAPPPVSPNAALCALGGCVALAHVSRERVVLVAVFRDPIEARGTRALSRCGSKRWRRATTLGRPLARERPPRVLGCDRQRARS